MILVIDIGNTTIAFTGFAQKQEEEGSALPDLELLFEKKLSTETGRDVPRFVKRALRLLTEETPIGEGASAGFSAGSADGLRHRTAVALIAISSVVPTCTPAAVALSKKLCSVPPVLISNRLDTGISLARIPAPETIGADRLADIVWAAARYPLPVMTVDLGTATTINVIGRIPGDERPAFLGGMIGAGVRTSLLALRALTAQLPALEPEPVAPEDLIGIDTKTNMLSSAVVGTAAMIEGMADRVEEQLKEPVTLLLTGGNARVVAPWMRREFAFDPDMTAKGTAAIALRQMNRK